MWPFFLTSFVDQGYRRHPPRLQVPLKRPRRHSAAYCLVPILRTQSTKVGSTDTTCRLLGLKRDTAANAASILESWIDHRTSRAQSCRTHPPTSSHLPICPGCVESIQWMKGRLDPSSCSKNSPRNPPDATHLAPTTRKLHHLILRACKLPYYYTYLLRTNTVILVLCYGYLAIPLLLLGMNCFSSPLAPVRRA
ncbi:hypothetical protein BDP81DRAFT_133361 [Colletotrichum phormii]|uniref:Uncharacterized protein n=1 Tax=Colletotrichum phormii TaxID=359342 RepID=A0AAJ0A067_9PEZI|nr:uncharacterized protein BDP81DRAFT_133361 [Colletotrichum phormii]KAK1641428.1 hypothetical protein BDP81DRAFT_133361 [Colletotrichum phormii]